MPERKIRTSLIIALFGILAVIVFGLIWFFFGASNAPVGAGWYLFSFAAGLSMIILPCTLPLAFVIVPLSMGKGVVKGFLIALAFGLGVAFTLSIYGVLAAILGKVAIGSLGAPLEVVKNWLYFIAGVFAYLFSLGQLGLLKFKMPSYSGAFPGFIQRQSDVLKALLLGLFLGNIGVGCPHPATPVILTRIAVSGDVFYGWLLFFVHAIGRILPLLFLALLGILGVNALAGLVKRKEKIERATGWGMVFVAGFILILGLFSHDWWVISGQHTYLEELTQEDAFTHLIAKNLNSTVTHSHGLPPADHTGLFGLPLALGTWALLFFWIAPFFWYYSKRKKATEAMADSPEKETNKKTLPYIFWNIVTLSLLLTLVFGYVLPHRFLEHVLAHTHGETMSAADHADMHTETGGGHMHGPSMLHEEGEVLEGIAVNLNAAPKSPEVGEKTKLDFLVNIKPANTAVPSDALEIEHEKIMHVIGVRKDLTEFFHIHPAPVENNPGLLSTNHAFQKPGDYKIWSEIKYEGANHIFGHPFVTVGGAGATFELNKEIKTNTIVGRYQVGIEYENLQVGDNHIDLSIKTLEGKDAPLDNYLGVKMHLSVISEDLKQFIHTHPEGHDMMHMDSHTSNLFSVQKALAHGDEEGVPHDDANDIHFNVPFPAPGFYKAFAEFKPTGAALGKDEALRAEFWVEVRTPSPTSLPPRVTYTLVSLALIFAVSWAVKKYITV